ncbi:hypothetical protein FXV83_23785 [Bradyrhizobium hipponense]|uniref:Uncharacterized protein n=1 Tax=Bradyrhizobium hipponense TaxID=2605638 RepID=A0A5S4YL62_9BRAD|nr:hypothetical protein [Bradyrhizobium hipponense]TYO64095.1 hypothetical protein FXV83_23785 [Bradyrhizobium hipponense]
MRKLILIAALSLLATQAYAGGSRSLSLAASNSSQQAPEQPVAQAPSANVQTATTTSTSTPPVAAAPTTVSAPAATTPAAAPVQSTGAAVASTTETTKPKRRQPSTEARVIRELHRHGIYW